MIAYSQTRKRLIKRIRNIPESKLRELDDFLLKIEKSLNKKEKNLSFAGSWNDVEQDLFESLTDKLISNRIKCNKIIKCLL